MSREIEIYAGHCTCYIIKNANQVLMITPRALKKYWLGTEFQASNSKAIG